MAASGVPAIDCWPALARHPGLAGRFQCESDFVVGGIPIGPPERTAADGIMLVGDVAGQVKPVSGGGIYWSLICGKLAGTTAALAAAKGDASLEVLSRYDDSWREKLGSEIELGMRFHGILSRLTDGEIDHIFEVLDDPEILDVIATSGDIDRPSAVIGELVRRGKGLRLMRLAKYLGKLV
jgi:flavin-dependent dehydrogenase